MTKPIYDFLFSGLSMKTVGIFLGLFLIAVHGYSMMRAESVQRFLKTFPRNYKLGAVFLVIAALWALVVQSNIHMGEFFKLRRFILIAIPILTTLMILYVEEFLSVRALGALLLLASAPVLKSAFLQEPTTRLLLPILAYVWILAGIFFVGMPYLMRDGIAWITKSAERWKIACVAGLAYGIALVALAVSTY